MSQIQRTPRTGLGSTLAYRPASDSPSVAPPPCRVAHQCGGSGSQFHTEIESLLRSRLRLVSLLLLAPTAFFLGKRLVDLNLQLSDSCVDCLFHGGVTVFLAVLTALVWFKPCLNLHKLRAVELMLFGVMTAF